jgi:catechol 2,3-dioxygenase-like lactoylglutathione lyase family enzyme
MAITLNHTIVPARDKVAAARFFAGIFGLDFKEPSGRFAPVHVNETLTVLFSEDTSFDGHHYAFHVSDAEFDAILGRIKKTGLAYGMVVLPGASTTAKSTTGAAAEASTSRTRMDISLS